MKGKVIEVNKYRVTICAVNSRFVHTSLAPWYLSDAITKRCGDGYEVNIVEGNINEHSTAIVKRIIAGRPDLVGFSCYIWNIEMIRELVGMVKDELPKSIIVLGGPEVSYNALDVMKDNPEVDYIVSGEGELPFAMLVESICCGEKQLYKDIPGLCRRTSDGIIVSNPHTTDVTPESPYSEKYLEHIDGKIAYLETSRGCPFRCAFCLSGQTGGARFFPVERAKCDMLKLANSGAKVIKLVDRTFNADRKRAAELFQFIISHYGTDIPEGVTFHFEIAGDLLDDDTLSILSTAPPGLIQMEIGLQSFCKQTLEAINRKTNVELLKYNIGRLMDMGNIHIHVDLICGLPFEDLSKVEQSFNTAIALRPHMLQLGFLKLLHGAQMREEPENFPCSHSPTPPYEVISTPWLSEEDMSLLYLVEEALNRMYNSGRFNRTLQYVLDRTELSPFNIFRDFGEMLESPIGQAARSKNGGIPLDKLTELALNYFSSLPGVELAKLKDMMICDRLATNNTGWLPPILRVELRDRRSSDYKNAVRALKNSPDYSGGFKRGYAPLETEDYVIYVEYKNRNPVTGEYPIIKVPLGD
jgi:radical SAM superfamily enzyme YgiQ (UPF0313 family)